MDTISETIFDKGCVVYWFGIGLVSFIFKNIHVVIWLGLKFGYKVWKGKVLKNGYLAKIFGMFICNQVTCLKVQVIWVYIGVF